MTLQTQEKERAQNELHSITAHCHDLKRENQTYREHLKKFGTLHNENCELVIKLEQATEHLTKERDALKVILQTTEAQVHCCKFMYANTHVISMGM